MDIYLHNTMSGKKELFTALRSGKVGMYNCGPTVYDYAHVGNLRSYVFADVLRRMFEYNDFSVTQIINITDIGHLSGDGDDGEDKMSKALKREGKPMTLSAMREIADFYFEKFTDDLNALHIELPAQFPFASDHIAEDIALITALSEKGFTYTTSDGLYFDTSKFAEYGKLGNQVVPTEEHSRIGVNLEKKNSRDFALWKFSSVIPGSTRNLETKDWMPDHVRHDEESLGYDAPFGKGFPGWHIECSAMSVKYLGPEFDIHTGGIDHIPVHHNNEIAQAVCAGYPYAHYWMHNEHLKMGEEKMSKSGKSFITLQILKEKNINPLALRYFFLTARYSSPIDFSFEALTGSLTALKRLKKIVNRRETSDVSENTDESRVEYYKNTFRQYVNDNIDTPKALALIWDLVKDDAISQTDKNRMIVDFDRVLGLGLADPEEIVEIPEEVKVLIAQRKIARDAKDWKTSDALRTQIEELGFHVKDTDVDMDIS